MKTYSEVLEAYDKGKYMISPYRKLRLTNATFLTDMSYGAGVPVANYYASTPLEQTSLVSKEGIFHPSINSFLHKATINFTAGSLGSLTLCDYVSYIPFIDGDSTDEQVFVTTPLPRYTDGKNIQVMLISQGSGTLNGNATLNYTNSDGVSGRTGVTFVDGTATVGTQIHSRSNFLQLQQGDSGVRSIEGFTFSTGIGGIYSLVFVNSLATIAVSDITAPIEKDFFSQTMTMPMVHKDAYLSFIFKSVSAVTVNLQAQLEFVY